MLQRVKGVIKQLNTFGHINKSHNHVWSTVYIDCEAYFSAWTENEQYKVKFLRVAL